ncbi:hypothetical protein [Roseobacter weihaiensis]|uniref:hypothetical protein n=1 Tax=Roseobacter weihaiensis TaxID=2763262 RepID=UPI001D09F33E|nr:hypothetical protein [Roseobacter sp. H9]
MTITISDLLRNAGTLVTLIITASVTVLPAGNLCCWRSVSTGSEALSIGLTTCGGSI